MIDYKSKRLSNETTQNLNPWNLNISAILVVFIQRWLACWVLCWWAGPCCPHIWTPPWCSKLRHPTTCPAPTCQHTVLHVADTWQTRQHHLSTPIRRHASRSPLSRPRTCSALSGYNHYQLIISHLIIIKYDTWGYTTELPLNCSRYCNGSV